MSEIMKLIESLEDFEVEFHIYDTLRMAAMAKAGCKLTVKEIGKDPALFENCVTYSPYMRRRLTLLRLKGMIQ